MKLVGAKGGAVATQSKIDLEAQWRQVLGNIKELVEEAGGSMADIVMAEVLVTDMQYYAHYQHIREEFFTSLYIVCTAVAVRDLVRLNSILEMKAIAYIEQ